MAHAGSIGAARGQAIGGTDAPRSIILGRKRPSPIPYDGKRQLFTVTVYNNCERCCTVNDDHRKQ